jgi:hypothetical protein
MQIIRSVPKQTLPIEIMRSHCYVSYVLKLNCNLMFLFNKYLLVDELTNTDAYICTGTLLDWYNIYSNLHKYEYVTNIDGLGKVFDELYKIDAELFKRIGKNVKH